MSKRNAASERAPAGLAGEIGKRTPFAHPQQEAYLNVLRTASVLAGAFERLFKAHGLSEPTYNALRILRGAGPAGCSCGQIGQQLVARVPDVTRLIDRLEKHGLAQRARTRTDRRLVLVQITPKGAELLSKLDGPVIELHQRQLAHLTVPELRELNRLLFRARHPARV